ncbi:glycosyltransferase family 4 protein [Gloeothece verrucosa]|uniref:Glycosyl transferase group 1 n=1 Tax=Gloeothece verrucosa (strain PCC 7822) TaxID=497965 RepID=E0UKW6_GLOV7|nr:glycosyltransferase family 4 protein [Gloeothece verrucosa]ADN17596.1 glycosyl transferase group 1 [Gloeothece verrucosa PCC 7822]
MISSKVLIAQLGARKHYQEPLLFHRWGILDRLYTDFYSGHGNVAKLLQHPKIYNRLPNLIKKPLDRYEPELENATIIHFPKFGYQYVQALKKASSDQASQIFILGGQKFCQQIIKRGLGQANIIYGFNSACLELFEYAKPKGIYCILDQTIADYSLVYQLLLEEEKRWPEWSLTPFRVNQADLELMEREHREQDLAAHIICGSSFVKDSLIIGGVDTEKISVVPLGRLKDNITYSDPSIIQTPQERGDGLRILFVGSVNLRKGIPYLLEALRQIKGQIPFTCKVVGSLEIKPERIAEYSDLCDFTGRIPRSQIKNLYTWADVLVLPSLGEGSAMVTYEALSLGVPIITTYNSGSIVRDGLDGFIVPIGNAKVITEKLLKIYIIGKNFSQVDNTENYLQRTFKESEHKLWEIITKHY